MLDNDILLLIPICFPYPDHQEYVKVELNRIGEILKKRDSSFSIRLQAAIIKYADGDIQKFDEGINKVKIDWRDILINAGFGYDINIHKIWIEEVKLRSNKL